jgi:hypothetical protein
MTRRSEIERLLREVREQAFGRDDDLDDLLSEEGGQRELKAYAGVDFDAFPLPEDARERVEQAIQPDHPARVVAVNSSDELDLDDSRHVIGSDPDALTGPRDEGR